MKKQDLFKFSLTAMCVAVLSACGSSGGGSLAVDNANTTPSANANANTGAANSAELAAAQKAAQEAAAQKAAAEKAAAEAAAKQAEAEKAAAAAKTAAEKAAAEKAAAEAKAAAEKAAAEKAAKEAAAKAAADQAAAVKKAAEEAAKKALAEKDAADKKAAADKAAADKAAADKAAAEKAALAEALKAQPFGNKDMLQNTPVKEGNSFVGFKHVVKNNSNLATNSSVDKDSTSDIPTMMGIQNPQRSLDNIVVAEPLQTEAGAPRTYLEDFDTRTLSTVAWKDLNGFPQDAPLRNNPALLHAEKKQTPTKGKMADYSIGNTALQNIYINSITVKDGKTGPGYDTAIEVERAKLADVKSKADDKLKKLNDAFGKANEAVEDFEKTLGGHLSAVGTNTGDLAKPSAAYTENGYTKETERLRKIISSDNVTGISVTDKELAQQELDVLLKKHNQLSEAAEKAKAPIADQEVVAENAKNALNKFNAENPAPKATELSNVGQNRTGSAFGVITNPNGKGNTLYETKTDTMGTKIGAMWNFSATDIQNRHQNFTEHNLSLLNSNSPNVVKKGFVVHEKRDLNGNLRVNQYDIVPIVNAGHTLDNNANQALGLRTQDYSVAEIYGYRSKAAGSYDKPLDTVDNLVEPKDNKTPANNLPLVNDYKGARLQHVQYGRVTSALSDRTSTDDFYKTGVRMNDVTKTYVASFGEYGADGTENHFFFRGIDNVGGVGGTTLAKLKEDTKNGVITYEGHAVTYGLNNNFMGNREIPTALGNGSGFVSGNHAKAAVNLATNAVTGSIFNKWYDPASPKALRDIDLVQFKGTIADNGNIAGDAVRVDNQTTGLFGAALYGAGAEMGGTVASHDKAAGKHWGGVFGAIRTGVEEAPKKSPQDGLAADGKI